MLLKACLNGSRQPDEHPSLPITPADLAAEVVRVMAAGAGAVHLHPKNKTGADTLSADEVAAVVTAVRAVAADLPLGVTTGAWAVPDPDERVRTIETWSVLPDFASVNWHEPGAEEVAAALLAQGVGVEAGLWHAEAVAAWFASPYRDRSCRVLLSSPTGWTRPRRYGWRSCYSLT